MLSTIQPIGSKPVKPPSIAALPAISAGMPYAKIAMASAATRPSPAATCAFKCRKPSPTSITATGTAAKTVETAMLANGSYDCCQTMGFSSDVFRQDGRWRSPPE